MTYTITCPNPDCKTTFELDDEDFEPIDADGEPIECPGCEVEFEWTFDEDATPQITLTDAVQYADEPYPMPGEDEDDLDDEDEDDE
jgi:hypothetical protein